ncbi:MAG: N-succinylarginine dihydrolase [Legionella sp.]|nr:N-succinylarginine dihydrolase [Legionella sp.]
MRVFELNIDGLVGPTHHYAGLSAGNLASTTNALKGANPQEAARQGLAKMGLLHNMGLKQALLPPHQRPNLHLLYQLGFTGEASQQVSKAFSMAPELLSAAYSASSMWTANAATVSASSDCTDNRVHFTAANLVSNLHRHQEADFSAQLLRHLFKDEAYFNHHPILPRSLVTGDEGAANHSRLCANHSQAGINFFVYGKQGLNLKNHHHVPLKYPARQTLEASSTIARAHCLNQQQVVFACQNPQAIDEGVFHNDVIAVANESVLLVHEFAFKNQKDVLKELQDKANFELNIIEISNKQLTVADAVATYLFNSQLLSMPDGTMTLIAPIECESNAQVKSIIDEIISDSHNPIKQVHYLDLKQSMRNGGGPACLRLRVPLNENELGAMHQGILITDTLLDKLDKWIIRHYRTHLHANDLKDPSLIDESFLALDELTNLLDLGSIYPFQREKTV